MARGLMESYLIDFEYMHAFWSEFPQLVNRIIPILRYVCVKGSIIARTGNPLRNDQY